jgi:hypothetical protein
LQLVLGFFSFTEVTDPGAHRAYNEWHQLDHQPEQFTIEGITFGQRWVCSPRCAETRVAVSPLLAPCHYMTLYLMRDEGPLPEFFELAKRLHREGRFFEAREAHLTGPFEITGQWAAKRVRVSAAAVPFRPAAGVYVVVGAAGHGVDGAAMTGVDGVAGAWQFAGTGREDGGVREITVAWVDGDLWEASAQLGELCRSLGSALEWAGPLERVDPYAWDWFE